MRTPDEILALHQEREKMYRPLHNAMREIQAIYDGKATVPLSELNRDEPSSVPNLLAQGVEQMAGRVASITPMVSFSSEQPGVRKYDRRAEQARRVVTGWHQMDRLSLKKKLSARHLLAYGLGATVVRYDAKLKRPTWDVRSPLECFPSMEVEPSTFTPLDVVFAYRRSVSWLRSRGYAENVTLVTGRTDTSGDTEMMVLEYVDHDGIMLVLTGVAEQTNGWMNSNPITLNARRATAIDFAANPSGQMQVVVPTRITLSRTGGQFDTMVGMYYAQSKLMALEIAAVEKGVFPDAYLVGRPGETPRFVDGPYDGRTGQINVVTGGDVKEMSTAPGYMTPQTIDRLERAQRLTAGIPAEFGGESGSNIRTGRRGDAVLSAVIDFPVAEAQDIMAFALHDENKAAIALAKHYDGSAKRMVFVGTGNAARAVTYVSTEVFSNDEHVVSYPASGTDLNSLMIGLGQRVGMGIMSKETAAALDPFVESPEMEHDRIISEGLEQALVSGIQQQAASGQIPPMVLAKVMMLVKMDKMELADALNKVAEDAAKEQAKAEAEQQTQQQGAPGGPPTADQLSAPAAQASLAGASPIPGASAGQADLAGLLSTLRQPAMTVQPMRGVASGAM
jgi:hypothetical protein